MQSVRTLSVTTKAGVKKTEDKHSRAQMSQDRNVEKMFLHAPFCKIKYYPSFLSEREAAIYLKAFLDNAEWHDEEALISGKKVKVPRRMVYYGTTSYYYSGSKKNGSGWPEWLIPLKEIVEEFTGFTYNFALANYYKDGNDYIGYHSDDEKDLDKDGHIASISLGAARDFLFQRRYPASWKGEKESVKKIHLLTGSLLIMGGNTQTEYKHSLPIRKKCTEARVNITFRVMKEKKQ